MGGDYNLVPGVSVGEFVLGESRLPPSPPAARVVPRSYPGESLWHILDVLRASKIRYPKVEISWDTEVRRPVNDPMVQQVLTDS